MCGRSIASICSRQIVHRVQQIAFEAVERLQPDGDVPLAGMVADGALRGDRALLLGRRRPAAGESAERRMQRAAQRVGAKRLGAIDRPFHIVDAGLARRGIRRNQVHRRIAHRRDRCALQPDAVEQFAELLVVVRRTGKDRYLDAVKAGRLDVPEQRLVLLRDAGRPQEHAHADFHRHPSPFDGALVSSPASPCPSSGRFAATFSPSGKR